MDWQEANIAQFSSTTRKGVYCKKLHNNFNNPIICFSYSYTVVKLMLTLCFEPGDLQTVDQGQNCTL